MSILIPIYDSNGSEALELPVDALPEDAYELVSILQRETAPPALWMQCALAYYAQGRGEQFKAVCESGADIPEDLFPDTRAERVGLVTALAGYHVNLGASTSDKKARKQHFDAAAQHYSRADTIDIGDHRIWLGRGFLNLHRGEPAKARHNFEQALRSRPLEPLALLGKACVCYASGAYLEALRLFQQLMTVCAAPPAGVRVGLGLCYAQLKQPARARACFERALELDPADAQAALALALAELNEGCGAGGASVRSAVERLGALHRADPANPNVLNQLANHFFYRKEFDRVERLARQAYQVTGNARVRAESFFHLGRVHQVRGNVAGARQFYSESAKHAPAFMLAHYGLGQMHMRAGDARAAADALARVAKAHPKAPEPLRALGALHVEARQLADAQRVLERLVALDDADPHAWALLAEVLVRAPNADADVLGRALGALAAAVDAHRQRREPTPAALWNNIGVIRARLGQPADAEDALQRALKLAAPPPPPPADASSPPPPPPPPLGAPAQVTTTYNLARLRERRREFGAAEELYRAIARAHPTYADAFIGLASCALARGERAEAEARLRQASALQPTHADTRCALGRLHADVREWHRAKQAFDSVLREGSADDRRDAYAMISVANIYAATASKADDADARRAGRPTKLERALELYLKVLGREPSNLYAAQGVGVVLAEKGYLQEAKEVFTLVLEAGGDSDKTAASANLAHMLMIEQRPVLAIKLYENSLQRAAAHGAGTGGNSDAELALRVQLAHAQYRAGQFTACRRTLGRALRACPQRAPLWYDGALALYRAASATHRDERAQADALRTASAQVQLSARILSRLAQARSSAAGGGAAAGEWRDLDAISAAHAKAYAAKCAELRAPLRERYNDAQARRSDEEARVAQIAEALESQRRAESRAAGEAQQAAAIVDAAAEARLAEQRARQAQFLEQWQQEKAKEQEVAARREQLRRARDDDGAYAAEDDDAPADGAPRAKKPKRRRKADRAAAARADESDSEPEREGADAADGGSALDAADALDADADAEAYADEDGADGGADAEMPDARANAHALFGDDEDEAEPEADAEAEGAQHAAPHADAAEPADDGGGAAARPSAGGGARKARRVIADDDDDDD